MVRLQLHKGWTVLIAVAVVGLAFVVMLLGSSPACSSDGGFSSRFGPSWFLPSPWLCRAVGWRWR